MLTRRTMVLSVIIAFILSVSVLCTSSYAFQNEPTGFRGFTWGTWIKDVNFKITKLPSSKEAGNVNASFYLIDDMMSIRTENDKSIYAVVALDNRLIGATMSDLSNESMISLLKSLIVKYGDPTHIAMDGKILVWRGKHSVLTFVAYKHIFIMGSRKGMDALGRRLKAPLW